MKATLLSETLKLGETAKLHLVFEGNPGYIKLNSMEMLVAEGEDFEAPDYEVVYGEMPNNDYKEFDGENFTAVYGLLDLVETSENEADVTIKRVR